MTKIWVVQGCVQFPAFGGFVFFTLLTAPWPLSLPVEGIPPSEFLPSSEYFLFPDVVSDAHKCVQKYAADSQMLFSGPD